MKNSIVIFPLDKSVSIVKKQKSTSDFKFLLGKREDFEIDIFRLKSSKRENIGMSAFGKDRVGVVNEVIEKVCSLETRDVRRFIDITKRDLGGRIRNLKRITKMDAEEYRKEKALRVKEKKFLCNGDKQVKGNFRRNSLRDPFTGRY